MQRKRAIGGRVGARLAKARQSRGLSQAQLAKAIGVTTGTIQAYEHSRTRIAVERLEAVAEALQCEAADCATAGGTSHSQPRRDNAAQAARAAAPNAHRPRTRRRPSTRAWTCARTAAYPAPSVPAARARDGQISPARRGWRAMVPSPIGRPSSSAATAEMIDRDRRETGRRRWRSPGIAAGSAGLAWTPPSCLRNAGTWRYGGVA